MTSHTILSAVTKPITTTEWYALDTNILVRLHHTDGADKADIAARLVSREYLLSTQVISEYINVLQRVLHFSKDKVFTFCHQNFSLAKIHCVDKETLQLAERLVARYDFQVFDGIIIASALEAGCSIIYSEDMQDGMLVESRLRIVNPFR